MNKKLFFWGALNALILALVVYYLWPREQQDAPTHVTLASAGIRIELEGVQAFAPTVEGYLVSTAEGIFRVNEQGQSPEKLHDLKDITCLEGDWAASRRALYYAGKPFADLGARSYITDILPLGESVILADAGQKKLAAFDLKGALLWECQSYEGQSFKIPSPYFALSADGEGGFWVSDPGCHRLVQMDGEGRFKATWQPQAGDSFLGCCNPAQFCALAGGQFICLEKGLIRVRLFQPSGVVERVLWSRPTPDPEFPYLIKRNKQGQIALLDLKTRIIHLLQL